MFTRKGPGGRSHNRWPRVPGPVSASAGLFFFRATQAISAAAPPPSGAPHGGLTVPRQGSIVTACRTLYKARQDDQGLPVHPHELSR